MTYRKSLSQPLCRINWQYLSLRVSARFAVLVMIALLCPGCGPSLLTCPRVAKVPAPPPPQQHPAMVLFATDRVPESQQAVTFLSEMNLSGTGMSYGAKCEDPVTTGTAHCDEPEWLKGKSPYWLQQEEFLAAIRSANSDVVLFVHGFNYSFEESLQIALRMVQRTGVQAIPVAYSWPSQDRIAAYGIDYDRNEWTIEHLTTLIQEIVNALPEGKSSTSSLTAWAIGRCWRRWLTVIFQSSDWDS